MNLLSKVSGREGKGRGKREKGGKPPGTSLSSLTVERKERGGSTPLFPGLAGYPRKKGEKKGGEREGV